MATFYGGEQLVSVIETEYQSTAASTTLYTVPSGHYANMKIIYCTVDTRFQVKYNTPSATNVFFTLDETVPTGMIDAQNIPSYVLTEGSQVITQGSTNHYLYVRIEIYKKP